MNNLPKGWQSTTLGNISENVMYGMNAKAIAYNGKHKYIRITDIDEGTNKFRPNPLTSPDGSIDQSYKLVEGDLVFARTGASVGKSYMFEAHDGDLYFAGFLIRFHIVDHVPYFVFLQTQTSSYRNWVKSVSMRSGQPGINAEEFKKLPIVIAPKKEQIAISNTIQTWDTAIEKTEALMVTKEKRFGWLVKSLIEKNQDKNSWEHTTLGELFDIKTYPSKSSFISGDGDALIVDMGAISRGGDLVAEKRCSYQSDFLNAGDLVMPKDDIGGGNIIGKVAIIESDKKFICGDHVYRLVSKKSLSPHFLMYAINANPINRRLRAKANGTAQLGLGKADVARQPISIPSLARQENISAILNTAKQEIGTLKKLIEQYRKQKCGLMKQLLTGATSL